MIFRNSPRLFHRILLVSCLATATASAQPVVEYNHPELQWRTIETTHFAVHFHQGEERTARKVADVAERVYGPVTELYGYVPDTKIHFIVRDHEDDSNGAAFYYDNKIEVWAAAMDFALRGTHAWIEDVVTHEFSHMISLGAARKGPRTVPAAYIQWIGYEKEKRPDVIHGYPNRLASVPVAGTVVPMWFAEGMAQFQRAGWGFDTWDAHRDMMLRAAALSDRLLTLGDMEIFGKNSLGNERVYNQGYAFLIYLTHRYGESVLGPLAKAMSAPLRLGFDGAAKKVLGKGEDDLYRDWTDWLKSGYAAGTEEFRSRPLEGRIVEPEGIGNFTPAWSPDGSRLAYISSRGRDYMGQTGLWVLDSRSGKSRRVAPDAGPGVSWSPDGSRLVYSRRVRTRTGSHYFDAFECDPDGRHEKRITRGLRFRQPVWSPEGRRIAGVVETDGTSNLVLVGSTGEGRRAVTAFTDGEEIHNPRWMPDGRLVFGLGRGSEGRDIAAVDTTDGRLTLLVATGRDERDPFPSADGGSLYYASDSTGIFGLYRLDLATGRTSALTRTTGGAFFPCPAPDGRVAFSLFREDGYKIAVLDSAASVEAVPYASPYKAIRSEKPGTPPEAAAAPPTGSRPYAPAYSKMAFMPRLMIDFPNRLKAGLYFYGSDVLDKTSVFGGAAANALFDTDVFLSFTVRRFFPTLFLEAYHVSRHTSEADVDYRNAFLEADLGADWPLGDRAGLRTAVQASRYDAAMSFLTSTQKVKIPYTYHKGVVAQAQWTYRAVPRTVFDTVPARGRKITIELDRASQRFMQGFGVHSDYGTLVELYKTYNYTQCMLDWTEYVPAFFRDHSIGLRLQAGAIDRPVDSFYHFFAGGLDGLRGYSFYSIEGRKMARLGLSYRFPIARRMGLRLLWLHLDNLAGVVYGDAGNAWNDNTVRLSDCKRDAGLELRLSFVSFYSYPMCLFVNAAYGFDRFLNSEGQTQGREWRTYFGILFDFID
jgi:Tol biopolymer transport system component